MENKEYMIVDGVLSDNTSEIASYIDKLNGDEQETLAQVAAELRQADDAMMQQDLYFALAEASSALLKAPPNEFESAYNLLLYVITFAPDFNALMPVILANLTSEIPTSHPLQLAILAVLGNLFNIMPNDSPLRFDVFNKIIDFASASGTLGQLEPQFAKLPRWLVQWGVDDEAKTELLTKTVDILEQISPAHAFKLLLDGTKVDASSQLASRLALNAVENSFTYEFDNILDLPNVQKLESSNPDLYKLLRIVSEGKYAEFQQTNAKHNAKIAAKVKTLALASLAEGSRVLEYREIAESTGTPLDEVETLIINGIKARLFEGRMDQLTQKLFVERSSVVGPVTNDKWKEVDNWLDAWRSLLTESKKSAEAATTHVERLMV